MTRDFKETVRTQIERVPAFRAILLEEGVESLLAGDVEAGEPILCGYVDATVGFQEVAGLTNKSSNSLTQMLRPRGNPRVRRERRIYVVQTGGGLFVKRAARCALDARRSPVQRIAPFA